MPTTHQNKVINSESITHWYSWSEKLEGGIALGALLLAIVTAAGFFISKHASRLRQAEEIKEQREFKETISRLTAESEIAKSDAAQANARAEEARLETLKIKSVVEWRDIEDDKIRLLSGMLAQRRLSAEILHVANDSEAMYFASRIREGFSTWNVYPGSIMPDNLIFGVFISGQNQENVSIVRAAFSTVGILTLDSIPKLETFTLSGSSPADGTRPDISIIVGSKPRKDKTQ